MRWFFNFKIAVKLLISFILVAIIAGIVGLVGIINIKEIESKDKKLYSNMTVPISHLADISTAFQKMRVSIRDMIFASTDEEMNIEVNNIKDLRTEIDKLSEEYDKLIISDSMRSAFNTFTESRKAYKVQLDKMIEYSLKGNDKEAMKGLKPDSEAGKAAAAEQEAIDVMQSMMVMDAKTTSENNTDTANTAILTMIVFILIGMFVAVLLGIFISNIISKPIKKMVEVANKLALGDINVNVESTTKEEIGMLMESFSNMIINIREQALAIQQIAEGDLRVQVKVKSEDDLLGKKLSEMVEMNNGILSNINSASEQVAVGAKQVSSSSQALSQGSTEQASSVEEITSSITQVAAQTKVNAIKGNEQMQEMVKAMSEINDSSSNISKIIKVIDEIAFQTNILALNAAVEAARAGQHGKGFAVVAEEVRNLAARSASAAKETTVMIEGSIKKVEIGTKIANETAIALNSIVDGVAKAATIVADIATASNEQATGISQINQAIEQVAQVIQTNSATAEESAAASEELSSQAELLKESVSKFKLKEVSNLLQDYNDNLSPEVLRIIESMINKKNNSNHEVHKKTINLEAAHSAKPKISLGEGGFGKY